MGGQRDSAPPSKRGSSLDQAIEATFFGENPRILPRDDGTIHRLHHRLSSMVGKAGKVSPDKVKEAMIKRGFVFDKRHGTGRMIMWEITPPSQ